MTEPLSPALSDEVFRRCFEDSTDGIVLTDVEGRMLRANPAWLAMHGYVEAEVLGQTLRLVRGPHTTREVYDAMWADIRDPAKGSWKGELVNRRKDGTELPVLVTITPVREAGRIAGYMGISLDMRERKEVEELKRLYELVVWHDLKSPLGTIRALLDALAGGFAGPLAPSQEDLIQRAVKQCGRMAELIATTLDLERLKSRKLQMDLHDVDLVRLCLAAIEGQQDRGRQLEVEVKLSGAPSLLVRADPLHAQRCLDNLVKNAIEAAPRKAIATVVVEGRGAVGVARIHNPGKPIPAPVRATLFHPFGTYGKRGGTGLGLYGVKLLVEAMSGAVRYETGDEGTTFELEFPAAVPSQGA